MTGCEWLRGHGAFLTPQAGHDKAASNTHSTVRSKQQQNVGAHACIMGRNEHKRRDEREASKITVYNISTW